MAIRPKITQKVKEILERFSNNVTPETSYNQGVTPTRNSQTRRRQAPMTSTPPPQGRSSGGGSGY